MPNKVDAIQQFIVPSSVYLLSLIYAQSQVLSNKSESTLPSDNPVSHILPVLENPKCSQLSVQVIADIDSELCSKYGLFSWNTCVVGSKFN